MHHCTLPAFALLAVLAAPTDALAQSAVKTKAKAHATAARGASAADWRSAYSDETMTVAVDPSKTTRTAPGTYRARLRWAYTSDQPIGRGQTYRTMVETRLVDCRQMRSKPVSAETFDASDKAVSSYTTPDADLALIGWSKRKPGTPGAKAYAAICREIKAK